MLLTFDPLPEMLLRSKILFQNMDSLLQTTEGDVGLQKTRSVLPDWETFHKLSYFLTYLLTILLLRRLVLLDEFLKFAQNLQKLV